MGRVKELVAEAFEAFSRTQRVSHEDFKVTPATPTVSSTGALRDNRGKVQYSLLPFDLMDGAARVMEFGSNKYGRNNYRKGFPPIQPMDSLLRHCIQLQKAIENEDKDGAKGFLFDSDTGEADIHHMLCNVLILIDSMRKAGYKV